MLLSAGQTPRFRDEPGRGARRQRRHLWEDGYDIRTIQELRDQPLQLALQFGIAVRGFRNGEGSAANWRSARKNTAQWPWRAVSMPTSNRTDVNRSAAVAGGGSDAARTRS